VKVLSAILYQSSAHSVEEFLTIKRLVKKCECSSNEHVPADFFIVMSRNKDDR
jgi:hypothetical protein